MEPKFMISEVLRTSWKHTKSQIWVLTGLFIGYIILYMTLSLFSMPTGGTITMTVVAVNLINIVIGLVFCLGYLKNIFQTLDGDEPQFSAYGQQFSKTGIFLIASILMCIVCIIGSVLFIIPGIYLNLRLQFYPQIIIEEDAGIMESLKRSWEITRGHAMKLFLLTLAMAGIAILGLILLGIGIFIAVPLIWMMQTYTYRKLIEK